MPHDFQFNFGIWAKINESKQTVLKLFSPKAAEFSGAAGEFRCLSLHRSQISKDL
jgi:hypothetical protein